MRDVVDPEFDPTPTPQAGVCITGRCDGSGWIQVSEAYVDHWAGQPPSIPEGDTPEDRAVFEIVHRFHRAKRAASAASSYPCGSCMPIQFDRWAGGHWERHHNRDACAPCRRVDTESGRRPRRQPKESTAHADPGPTDSDAPPPEIPEPPPRLDLA